MYLLKISPCIFLCAVNCCYSLSFLRNFNADVEFAKDIASVVEESTLSSKCNANTFMTSKNCGYYVSAAVKSLGSWAPPVLVISFDENTLGLQEERRKEQWNKFLMSQHKSCNLVLICDLSEEFNSVLDDFAYKNESFTNTSLLPLLPEVEAPQMEQILNGEFLNLRKFVTTFDNILYLYNPRDNGDEVGLMGLQQEYGENEIMLQLQNEILKHSGIMLFLEIENRSLNAESLLRVFSKCEFCGKEKQTTMDLGSWQRNKTHLSKFFSIFEDYKKADFNGYNLTVGYFEHPPHFNISIENGNGTSNYSGVEWQMLMQMSESLNFIFNLVNLTHDDNRSTPSNISKMIEALRNKSIELAVGGIGVTPERKASVDFSNIFSNEPIVFVVAKRQDIYILGILLAFQPQVWPIILLLIVVIALLFRTILREPLKDSTHAFLSNNYIYLLLKKTEEKYKYKSIGMFKALEITMTPLLGQSLSASQLSRMSSGLLKIILCIWWFSCLIISTFYNTSLITSLINPVTPKEPESLQDLIQFGYKFKMGCKPGVVYELITTDIETKFESNDNRDAEKASEENAKLIHLLKQIQSRLTVGSSSSLVAYVVEESSVDEINWKSKDIGFSQIKVIRERLFLTSYGWPLQRAAPYKEKINTALGRLASAGLIDYWYMNYSHKEKEPTDAKFKLRKTLGQIHLNMEVLQGAFFFLALGCGVAMIAFAFEHFTVKYTFRFFTRREVNIIFGRIATGILYVIDKINGRHKNRVVFVKNEGNTPVPNHKFREAVLEIVNIRKSYPYMK